MSTLIFLDLDGTVLDSRQQVPDSARRALTETVKRGHTLFMCTGRSIPELYPSLWDFGFRGVVSSNGAFCQLDQRVLADHSLSAAEIVAVEDALADLEARWWWQTAQGLYSPNDYLAYFHSAGANANGMEGDWTRYLDHVSTHYFDGTPTRAAKGMFTLPAHSPITIDEVRQRLAPWVDVLASSVTTRAGMTCEMVMHGVSKGRGLREVAEALNHPIERTLAIGDSDNDVSMFDAAGMAIAMGHCTPAARDAADWVSTELHDDGLARALAYAGVIE